MRGLVVGKIFVGFVRDMVQAVMGTHCIDGPQGMLAVDGTRWVVWRDCYDGSSSRRYGGLDPVEVGLVTGIGWDQNGPASQHLDGHLVVEVVRDQEDNLITGVGDSE